MVCWVYNWAERVGGHPKSFDNKDRRPLPKGRKRSSVKEGPNPEVIQMPTQAASKPATDRQIAYIERLRREMGIDGHDINPLLSKLGFWGFWGF